MSAWFALTQDRLRCISDYTDAGINAAPHASVPIQLAAQAAKAHARMGNPSDVRRHLDHGARLLGEHDHPTHPQRQARASRVPIHPAPPQWVTRG